MRYFTHSETAVAVGLTPEQLTERLCVLARRHSRAVPEYFPGTYTAAEHGRIVSAILAAKHAS